MHASERTRLEQLTIVPCTSKCRRWNFAAARSGSGAVQQNTKRVRLRKWLGRPKDIMRSVQLEMCRLQVAH
eukprot:6187230-Pleurochrysis_carterae.AAC.2